MASPSPTKTIRKPEYAKAVHCVSNAKGGVGKSFVASVIAQYLASKGEDPACFDTDPSNQTFARVGGLGVEVIDLLDGSDVAPERFDRMVEAVLTHDGPAVVDTGSSIFFPLWSYISQNDLFGLLADQGHPVVLHVPIAAGPDLEDTLDGFSEICKRAPERSVVAWLNQRDQRIELGGKEFVDLPAVVSNEEKLLGVVVAEQQLYKLHRDAVGGMIGSGMTFEQAIGKAGIMERRRIEQVRDELFGEMERIGI